MTHYCRESASLWRASAIAFIVVMSAAISGCRLSPPESISADTPAESIVEAETPATPTLTPAPTETPSPTHTPTPTLTPSPTPTPTATALPADVTGDPRAASYQTPAPQDGALCGIVDTLDYPLRPPDGEGVRGGQDFGRFRERYGSFHAGEDWWLYRGDANLGEPVYSIGHGRVIYAAPNGWGRDQGVLIVRHTFADGGTILSFYGHLDPPSVILVSGDCVVRGDKVGEIGQPRTPPHLHFEIRSHMPNEPGPGYWGEDPTTAGWEFPTRYIWNHRVAVAPGLLWHALIEADNPRLIGELAGGSILATSGNQLVRIDINNGGERPSGEELGQIDAALIDMDGETIYLADRLGRVSAWHYVAGNTEDPSSAPVSDYQPLWQVDLDVLGMPFLMTLPGGGVAYHAGNQLIAFSRGGERLWQSQLDGRIFAWTIAGDLLYYSTTGVDGRTGVVSSAGPLGEAVEVSGYLLPLAEGVAVYAADGVYRLTPDSEAVGMLYKLPTAYLVIGDAIVLPDGGMLLAHRDLYDRRLIALNADGSLRWERSLRSLPSSAQEFVAVGGRIYLVNEYFAQTGGDVTVFAIDLDSSALTKILDLPTRPVIGGSLWTSTVGDRYILLGLDQDLVLFDPILATEQPTGDD